MTKATWHKYFYHQEQGFKSSIDAVCPYGVDEIGKRCAWLAGYYDRHKKDNNDARTY